MKKYDKNTDVNYVIGSVDMAKEEEPIVEVKKITLEALLEKKLGADTSKTKEYFSEELGGTIDFIRISPDKVSDLLAQMNSGQLSQYEVYQQFIYFSCSLFQNEALISKYGVSEPFEVVYKVLNDNLAEVWDMGNILMAWYGFEVSAKKQ